MVDFGKLLGKERSRPSSDPIEIFNNLDKQTGKEYPRPPQEAVLREWYTNRRQDKDVIVKLHTGVGKTLIGLLMLQSYLNDDRGPAVYLCPNSYLVKQTIEQAQAFGIRVTEFTDTRPPQAFLNSDAILVATCNKVFNGKSVFGVSGSGRDPIHVGAIVVDDAHKCLDIIRDSFSIVAWRQDREGRNNPIYEKLWRIFEDSLTRQLPGTCDDIREGKDSIQAVPFWSWYDKRSEVLKLLSENKEAADVVFSWDLIKDTLDKTLCVFSGARVEISPRLLPIDMIPSFSKASHRIFLSATLNEDAFLVRDLGVDPGSVSNPLSVGDTKFSGERMILMPSLVDTSLKRERIVSWTTSLAKSYGDFGVVAIVPSVGSANYWESMGADVARVKDIQSKIEDLRTKIKSKEAKRVLVLVNEYDGVDLPDNTCRILCLDSLPSYNTLMDRYAQEIRPDSWVTRRKLAQRVEQGMGRGIRGINDWCIVIVAGNNLTDFLSEQTKRAFLSTEAQMQIRIAEELVTALKKEGGHLNAMEKMITQCIRRDEEWREFYREKMNRIKADSARKEQVDRAVAERKAEVLFQQGLFKEAAQALQILIDKPGNDEKGWILQQEATYLYPVDKSEAMNLQLKAHTENMRLFRPEVGVHYSRLVAGGSQASRALDWIAEHESHNSLVVGFAEVCDKASFASASDVFEEGLDQLGRALGFLTQRPEKSIGEGPDNLWNIQGQTWWLIECKNEVSESRTWISKKEAGQLNNTIGWFREHYEGETGIPVMIHPGTELAEGAYVNAPFSIMDTTGLKRLKERMTDMYNSLSNVKFKDLTVETIQRKLVEHKLDVESLAKDYLKRPLRKKGKE